MIYIYSADEILTYVFDLHRTTVDFLLQLG